MWQVLHILTTPDDSLSKQIAIIQSELGGQEVKIMDLTESTTDYQALLEAIFAADSVAVW